MTDTNERPTDLRQQPGVCPTCDGENIWLLVYEDQDMEPVLFSNHGADEAARKAFEHAATQWTVRLFKCVAQDGYGPGTGQQPSALDKYNTDLGHRLREAGVGHQPAQRESGEAGLARFGLQWNGPREFVSTPMVDGYWTPWHIAHEALTAAQQHIAEAEQERDALLSDWNAIVAASGSPTHGGAVGVVAEHQRRIRELEGGEAAALLAKLDAADRLARCVYALSDPADELCGVYPGPERDELKEALAAYRNSAPGTGQQPAQPATDERGRPLTYWGGLAEPDSGEASGRPISFTYNDGSGAGKEGWWSCVRELDPSDSPVVPMAAYDRLQSALTAAQRQIRDLVEEVLQAQLTAALQEQEIERHKAAGEIRRRPSQ